MRFSDSTEDSNEASQDFSERNQSGISRRIFRFRRSSNVFDQSRKQLAHTRLHCSNASSSSDHERGETVQRDSRSLREENEPLVVKGECSAHLSILGECILRDEEAGVLDDGLSDLDRWR